jgi:DNA-binding MarR family transcriptional regulator
MPEALSYDLYKLTALLDRAADRLLRREAGCSYSRFLTLFAVRQTGGSQRELARWLSQSEPSASRMVSVLAEAGLLTATRVAGEGNQRTLQLTEDGAQLVQRCTRLLEDRFTGLVQRSGVPYAAYQRYTRGLIAQLEADEQAASAPAVSAPAGAA